MSADLATWPQDWSDGFGHWLAGFIDGEGCFLIHKGRINSYRCAFSLGVRRDDAPVLTEIQHRTGIGKVEDVRRTLQGNAKPAAKWQIQTKADCLELVAILDRYPLRAKKARDYATWREAVLAWQTFSAGGNNAPRDWSRIATLREQLNSGRTYSAWPQP